MQNLRLFDMEIGHQKNMHAASAHAILRIPQGLRTEDFISQYFDSAIKYSFN